MLVRSQRNLMTVGFRLSRLSRSRMLAINHYTLPYGHHSGKQSLLLLRFSSGEPPNKIEETLRMLKELKQQAHSQEEKQMQIVPKPSLSVRVLGSIRSFPVTVLGYIKDPMGTLWAILHELKHYWNGFRLFGLETKLSIKYLFKKLRGEQLRRRERQQLTRTLADIFRLVPFSIFIIVPFMELLLPVFIKIFPQMLPSTFQELPKEEKKLKMKIEMAKFLQDTLEEIAPIRKKRGELTEGTSNAHEFAQFLRKTRENGYVTNADLFKFIKLFEDELTLDNLSISQLQALCRLLNISKIGPVELLRFRLHLKLRELKADDKLIDAEGGVEVLSVQELQAACRARGMRSIGLSEERLRRQLNEWLELSLDDQVPPSLLLLSRAMFFSEELNFTERLRTIISALPKEVGEHTTLKLKELEGITDPKARLEQLRSIEQALKKEREEEKQRTKDKKAKEAEAAAVKELAKEAEMSKTGEVKPDSVIAEEQMIRTAKELKGAAKEALDPAVLESLENLLHGSAKEEVKHDIAELKEKVIEHTEDLMEIGALASDYVESRGSKRLRRKMHKLISNMDSVAATLENQRIQIKEAVADPAVPEEVETKRKHLVQIKDLISSLGKLQRMTGDPKRIEQLLVAMDADVDGKVEADLILEVLEMLSQHKDVDISTEEMAKLVEVFKMEDRIEQLEEEAANGGGYVEPAPLEEARKQLLSNLPASDEQFPIRPMTPEAVEESANLPPPPQNEKPPPSAAPPAP